MSQNKYKYAEAAYNAFFAGKEGQPVFDVLTTDIKDSWANAAESVLDTAASEGADSDQQAAA